MVSLVKLQLPRCRVVNKLGLSGRYRSQVVDQASLLRQIRNGSLCIKLLFTFTRDLSCRFCSLLDMTPQELPCGLRSAVRTFETSVEHSKCELASAANFQLPPCWGLVFVAPMLPCAWIEMRPINYTTEVEKANAPRVNLRFLAGLSHNVFAMWHYMLRFKCLGCWVGKSANQQLLRRQTLPSKALTSDDEVKPIWNN